MYIRGTTILIALRSWDIPRFHDRKYGMLPTKPVSLFLCKSTVGVCEKPVCSGAKLFIYVRQFVFLKQTNLLYVCVCVSVIREL